MINRKYFDINENTAKVANDINRFSEYAGGTATAGYRAKVDEVYKIVEAIQARKPQYLDRALYMAERFSKKYAEYLNAYYRNEASCPSIIICGAGNFPVRKKEKQNARRDSLMHEYNSLMAYAEKIKSLLTCTQPINAADENAIEILTDKINELKTAKETAIEFNKHIRKGGTLEDFSGNLTPDQLRSIRVQAEIIQIIPHLDTSNLNAEIKRCEERVKRIESLKAAGTKETPVIGSENNEFCTVIENVELMRLQIVFPDIPSEAARSVLKSHGFKWAPSQNAWQRQLTSNAKYTLTRFVLPELEKICNA